jgi:GT2 family glycosyltransferase
VKSVSPKHTKTNFTSVIIPNYNGSATIGKCLEAAFASRYETFEVVVVDDCSQDNSVQIIRGFPCRLIRLDKHSGASRARNVGARNSKGDLFFFTDADCLLSEDALSNASKTFSEKGRDVVVGGTYTRIPHDESFFSTFQSVFVNHSETKTTNNPDYIATHAMVIDAQVFEKSGGFSEDFLPILEDIEFSHRLRRLGYRLIMNPDILVEHIFGYSLPASVYNATRKSMYWTMYSITNRDLLADSGTASLELKINVVSQFMDLSLFTSWMVLQKSLFLYAFVLIFASNLFINRKLLSAFYEAKGVTFGVLAGVYYTTLYPFAVGAGVIAGTIKYYRQRLAVERSQGKIG